MKALPWFRKYAPKKVSEVIGKNVFTSEGDYFGQLDDVNLAENKIDGWKIKVGSGFLSIMRNGTPCLASSHAIMSPVGPAPTIKTGSVITHSF